MENKTSPKWFLFFIRKNFPQAADFENDILDELGIEFVNYLTEELSEKIYEKLVPKNEIEIITNMDHPLKMNGFHPALLLHWEEYLKIKIE